MIFSFSSLQTRIFIKLIWQDLSCSFIVALKHGHECEILKNSICSLKLDEKKERKNEKRKTFPLQISMTNSFTRIERSSVSSGESCDALLVDELERRIIFDGVGAACFVASDFTDCGQDRSSTSKATMRSCRRSSSRASHVAKEIDLSRSKKLKR